MSGSIPRKLSFTIPPEGSDVKSIRVALYTEVEGQASFEQPEFSEQISLDETNSVAQEDGSINVSIDVAPKSKLDGVYTLHLWLVDDWGNQSDEPAILEGVVIDYVAPPTPVNLRLV